jgi:hypothetical protein
MKSFSQLEIKIDYQQTGFVGNKIEVSELFNQEISVFAYKIVPSKFPKPGRDNCLHMQIELNGEKRVVFVTSEVLMRVLKQIPDDDFPFKTTIKKNQKMFVFT